MRIPEEEIERVKRETDLVALVQSRGIELKRHGTKDWCGLCPFHADKETPNFIVTPSKGLFHCMSCGKGGNPIQFVQYHDGVSFRHAYELLRAGGRAVFTPAGQSSGPLKVATIPRLPCPLDVEADDAALLGQVAAYYHQKLKESPAARAYLATRCLDDEALIDRYQLGFADRTLGLRLPDKNRQEGERLRTRLTQLGVWRESGHEHFNGCIVVPFHECEARAAQATSGPLAGNVVSFYGRRVTPGIMKHLYPPGPHRGLFNRQCLPADEIILCEAVFDALTFCAHGFPNAMALFGTEGFTDELWEALKSVKRVRLAYDADEAGERAAQRDAERFRQRGVEVFRVKFPHGMDANEYACKVKPADKSLALVINGAAWVGGGQAAAPPAPGPKAEPIRSATPVPSPLLVAACVSSLGESAAKKEAATAGPAGAGSAGAACLEPRGDAWFLEVEGREYRVAGLEKTLGTDSLKVTLRVRVPGRPGTEHGLFHLDQVDLNRDVERRRFIERAAEETGLTADLLKRDLGRLLLAAEQAQAELLKPQEQNAPLVTLSPEEREEALEWLAAPNLIERLREAFRQSGIIGEETNTLVAYLACVSRKLERPLAIIIQSASAAGKTTLMDAVLSFFPEEERIKYSAMTGQSLYYLGETNLKHKILAVVEEAGAEKASYALKLLQSEGELTIASTGKDPQTGKMVTQEYHVEGPAMIFLTTTAVDLDEELQNRCLTLAVDETPEQTERIHRVQRERRTLAGLMARQERKELLRRLHNAQRLLAPVEIINPYAPRLTFATERTRNRRDHEKYLTLIDAIALLHQHQREKKVLTAGQAGSACCIEVTLADIALANELAPEVLARSLDELPPQTRRLLGYIRALLKSKSGSVKAAATFSRKELREASGWSLTQVIVHLERLVALEYVTLRHGRLGSQFVYEALFDLDAPEALAHIGLIDVAKLSHAYERPVSAFSRGVSGESAPVSGGDKTGPIPSAPLAGNALGANYRGNGIAHLDACAPAPIVT